MDSKIILYVLIFSILSVVLFIFYITDNYMPGKAANIYCTEQGYYGVFIKSENPPFSPNDYFCIINKGDTYNSKGALHITDKVVK